MKPTIKITIYNPAPNTDRIWPRARVLKAVKQHFPEAEVSVLYYQDEWFVEGEASVIASDFGSDRLNEAVETLVEHLAECAYQKKEPFQ